MKKLNESDIKNILEAKDDIFNALLKSGEKEIINGLKAWLKRCNEDGGPELVDKCVLILKEIIKYAPIAKRG